MNDEAVEGMIEAASDTVVSQILTQAEQLADITDDATAGLDYIQSVGLKLLRNVFSNSLLNSADDTTEEQLKDFYEGWIEEITGSLRVTPETAANLTGMKAHLQAQVDAMEHAEAG